MRKWLIRIIHLIRIVHCENITMLQLIGLSSADKHIRDLALDTADTFDRIFRENNEIWR